MWWCHKGSHFSHTCREPGGGHVLNYDERSGVTRWNKPLSSRHTALLQPWPTMGFAWTSARLASVSTPPSSSPAYQRLPACSSRWFAWDAGQSACWLCSWAAAPASCRYCCPDTTVSRGKACLHVHFHRMFFFFLSLVEVQQMRVSAWLESTKSSSSR